jgi:flagellin
MGLSLGINASSISAQRRLKINSFTLIEINEQLASGLRINRSVNDAAGLSIATGLNAQQRIAGQGIRNIDDAISALNVAELAQQELTKIVTRIEELATQSSNGVFNNLQRKALDSEAQSLRLEFERIVATTEFNGEKLLRGNSLSVQAGNSEIKGNFSSLTGFKGDGTFSGSSTSLVGASGRNIITKDFNNDGRVDIFTHSQTRGSLHLQQRNGTFTEPLTVTFNNNFVTVAADLDNDGDGTFGSLNDLNQGYEARGIALVDFNGDNSLDIIPINFNGGGSTIYLNDGSGSFSSSGSVVSPLGLSWGVGTIDFNRDGAVDFAITNVSSRITDIDIDIASADAVKQNLIQQISASIVTQANQQPEIALALLK